MTYTVQTQTILKGTPFAVTQKILETTDKKVWWSKINEYRKDHWIDLVETTATVKVKITLDILG
jgi:hypothetical protein